MSTADRLTTTLTAFQSWATFLACLRTGYVPTISRTRAGWKLARIVMGHGYPVYIAGRIVPGMSRRVGQ